MRSQGGAAVESEGFLKLDFDSPDFSFYADEINCHVSQESILYLNASTNKH